MRRQYRVGVFDDPTKARQAVDDAMAAGVSRNKIILVMPDNEPDEWAQRLPADLIIHPSDDTARGQVGGGFGGAVGGLLGALSLYGADLAFQAGLYVGLAISILAGAAAGAFFAHAAPAMFKNVKDSPFARMLRRDRFFDDRRSKMGGAIGGAFGSLAGTVSSYLIGIPSMWFFVSTGLWAAAVSVVVGSFVGSMSGRGLAPRGVARYEDLSDSGQLILVSIECSGNGEKLPEIEAMLRRDGATLVREE